MHTANIGMFTDFSLCDLWQSRRFGEDPCAISAVGVKIRVLFNGTQMHTARSGIDMAGTDRSPAVPSGKLDPPVPRPRSYREASDIASLIGWAECYRIGMKRMMTTRRGEGG